MSKGNGFLVKLLFAEEHAVGSSPTHPPAPSLVGQIHAKFARFERRMSENRLQIIDDFSLHFRV